MTRRLLFALLFSFFALYGTAALAGFTPAGAMAFGRTGGEATPLLDGRILFTGGSGGLDKTAELFDPRTNTFTRTKNDLFAWQPGHAAARLADGRVMIAGGGFEPMGSRFRIGGVVTTLFDPATETFTFAGALHDPRANPIAITLADGTALVAGGEYALGGGAGVLERTVFASAEIYDPATAKWTSIAPMHAQRVGATATMLPDGRVLIAGGTINDADPTAELYDPATKTFSVGAAMTEARTGGVAVALTNGDVLIIGGADLKGDALATTEIYVASAGQFVAAGSMAIPRVDHAAARLPNGSVLVAGDKTSSPLAELFVPATRSFVAAGTMIAGRFEPTATALPDGGVLVAESAPVAEIYKPDPPRRRALTAR